MALQLVTIPAHASLGKLKFVALLTVFFQVGNLLGAQPAQESSTDVNQLVHNSTAVVLRLLPEQISVPEQLVSCIARAANSDDTELVAVRIQEGIAWLREAAAGEAVVLTIDLPQSPNRLPLKVHFAKRDTAAMNSLSEQLKSHGFHGPGVGANFISYTQQQETNPAGNAIEPEVRAGIQDALATIENFPVQLLVTPPPHAIRTFRELMPELPASFGGGPSSVITEGFQWLAMGGNLESMEFKAIVQSTNHESAEAMAKRIPQLLQVAIDQLPERKYSVVKLMASTLTDLIIPEVKGDQIVITLKGKKELDASTTLFASLSEQWVEPIFQRVMMDRFKRLGLALHNYESAFKCFPPARRVGNEEGRGNLSWRVHVLPFLGKEGVQLYQQFHLDEPWDSEHNLTLLEKMPDVYSSHAIKLFAPGTVPAGHTRFLAPAGPGSILGGEEGVRIGRVVDGTSNTLFFVEVSPQLAVPWTSPADYQYDPADPAAGLGTRSDESFLAAMADGSVHHIPRDLPAAALVSLFQMNDGNSVTW
ncbi:MAG: DUF1559 domain-containing protein [Planctomycetales bacterium]|nr:DUF1559 domain-containing protein [Planctomycetales bacterium]